MNAQLSPCCKSIPLAMDQCGGGRSALAKSRPRVIITTATADNRKEKPSNNSAAGCSRVGTLPRKLGRKPGEALNAECMSIATITALPEALRRYQYGEANQNKCKDQRRSAAPSNEKQWEVPRGPHDPDVVIPLPVE